MMLTYKNDQTIRSLESIR